MNNELKNLIFEHDLIILDLFNTLTRNMIRLSPYVYIYKRYADKININSREFFDIAMTSNFYLKDLMEIKFNINIKETDLKYFNNLIKREMNSLVYFEELILELNKNNKKLVLLSNLSPEYSYAIQYLNKKLKFDKFILSYEVGILKPDKNIFQLAIKDFNIENNKILMLGDNIKLDIDGAKKVNIHAFQITHFL